MTSTCPIVVFSFDFELGWGVLESSLWRHRQSASLYTNLRPVMDRFVKVLNDAQIPTTLAIVSSLLASNEKDINIDHLPPSYKDSVARFYRESDESTRCGLDLVDKLGPIEPLIEIASHTSTHIYAEQCDVTSEQYVNDVRESINVLEKYFCTNVASLVFPRDQAKFNNNVAKYFSLNFRLNPNYGMNLNSFKRIVLGASRIYKMVPKSKVIMGAYGEYYQTGSLYLNWSGGSYQTIKKFMTKLQTHRLLNNMRQSEIYHIWLHPFNLAESLEYMDFFFKFIYDISELRDKGFIEVMTMKDVTKDCNKEILFQ